MACETCDEQITGTCKEFIKADCIYVTEELKVTGVQPDTVLTAALKRIDTVIGDIKNKAAQTFSLINIGTGAKVYKGVSSIGEKQLKTLTSTDGSVTIVENENEIDFAVEIDIPTTPSASETEEGISRRATQLEVDEGLNDTAHVTPLKLATYFNNNNEQYTLQILNGKVELLKDGVAVSSETLPTSTDSHVSDFTLNGTTLQIHMNDGVTIHEQDISSLLNFTQVQADFVQEDTTKASYIKNRNASKTVYADYIVAATDNTYVIVIDSSSAVTISLPSTLPDNFAVGFVQKGTGLVTIANADIVPEGFANTIKGKGHQAFVEKIEGTKFLFGNLNKAV